MEWWSGGMMEPPQCAIFHYSFIPSFLCFSKERIDDHRTSHPLDGAATAAGTATNAAGGEQSQLRLDFQPDCRAVRRQSAALVVGRVYSKLHGAVHVRVHAYLPDFHRYWGLGQHAPGNVGLGHCKLRLV